MRNGGEAHIRDDWRYWAALLTAVSAEPPAADAPVVEIPNGGVELTLGERD